MSALNEWFAYPWALVGLTVVPMAWWSFWRSSNRAAIRFSAITHLRPGSRTLAARSRIILPILRSLALALLVVCIARPRRADRLTRIQTEGIALQLVVDRSSSMAQRDFVDETGRPMSRLSAVKQVVRSFVTGDGETLAGRPDDLIGLIAFAHYSDTECPLTRDHSHLIRAVQDIAIPRTRDEDGTAIGDAMMLAVERIRNIGRRLGRDDSYKIKSRAIVLLTDGEQNRGEFEPLQAAEVAAAKDIKIYTIGAAPEFKNQLLGGGLFGNQTIRIPVQIDEATLTKVAEMTGGKYFRATDAASLKAIYVEIDSLERTVIDEQRFAVYEELATTWISAGSVSLPPPLMVALVLLGVEVLLANTRYRKIP